ncbi:unnamed protein product [Mytilus coruscus]|uniref:Uncharacterized protein n=1 Tax=Mytilus coruscus TaxID=42192 RepID=A0A6J8ERZ8_MYTCO|nr:unnamed protein product [Mytilus coruscus]
MNNGYAMYVWRDGYDPTIPGCSESDFLNWNTHSKCFTHTWDTHSRRQWLWSTCKVQSREIRKIFLADVHHKLRDGFNAKSCGLPGIQLIKQTVSEGHSAVLGLQIYALFAVSDIDVSEKDLIKYVVWYNDHCAAANEKFDGVAVNNEAYASIKCHSGQSEQIRYLQNLYMIKTEGMKQIHGRLLTHYSVSWHWGRCGSTQKLITLVTTFPQISDRAKLAGYQHALDNSKEIFVTLYTNKGDPCQTTFFPSPCNKGNHTEAGMLYVFDNFKKYGIEHSRPCIHYFRGIYSSGGNPDWPIH